MPTGFDHIVIAVNDLDAAIADYAAAGFTVTPGGEHKNGISHNALVTFLDGSYFEIIAFRGDASGHNTHWPTTLGKGEGYVDYALRTDDLVQEVRDLRAAGLDYSDPIDGGRFRPDGQRIDWQTIRYPGTQEAPSRLPFYCHDLTKRPLRVPDGEAAVHANGVTGVAGVTVVVRDIEAASKDFAALTGHAGADVEPVVNDIAFARRFPLGSRWIEAVQPSERESELRTYLETRGELPFEVTLRATEGQRELLDERQTHGARLLVIADAGVLA
jgi:catechol 2,3-dioxygenase-like lactoylglutathione lyase family enzyme